MRHSQQAPVAAVVQESAINTAAGLSRLAWESLGTEWGGLVWGRMYKGLDGPVLWIAAMTPGIGSSSAVGFELEPESYILGTRLLQRMGFPTDLQEFGLWHSHPTYRTFLSPTDEEYFHLCFGPSAVSVVIDPVNRELAIFAKQGRTAQRIPALTYPGRQLGDVPRIDALDAWRLVRSLT